MNEIDDVLSESMRRRAAEARLGGGSIADVQQRVVRRRRKLATVMGAALAVPALLALGIVIGQRTSQNDGVVSAGAAAGDAALPPSTLALPSLACEIKLSSPSEIRASDATASTPNCAMGYPIVSCGYTNVSGSASVGAPVPLNASEPATTAVEPPPATDAAVPVSCPPPLAPDLLCATSVSTAGPAQPHSSVPVPTPMTTMVSGADGCSMSTPTTWRCTDEVTTSSTEPGWRQFTECEPVFSYSTASTSVDAVASDTISVDVSPATTNP